MRSQLTRRCFLQATALATVAAPVIVPAAALGKNGRAAPSERITLGIIGAGERAGQLAQPLLSMAEPQIVAVCDPSRQKRETLTSLVAATFATRIFAFYFSAGAR